MPAKRVLLVSLFILAAYIPVATLAMPTTAGTIPRVQPHGAPAAPLTGGTIITVTYTSTVDNTALRYHEYLPAGYNPLNPYPAVILLPGSGGNINQYDFWPEWTNEADSRGYLLATIEPRVLNGYPGNRQTFYLNSALAPGEQDVLDAIADLKLRDLVSPARIYIAGYSMGGIGSLNLATLHPGLFAATAPGTSISDLFQENTYLSFPPPPSFATMFGGAPGASAITDTYYYQNSPRFLLPNLMHTPVWILHGISDTLIPNSTTYWSFMQSRHVVDTPGFSDSRGAALTLDLLAATYPGSYIEQHSWPLADHGTAGTWVVYSPTQIFNFFDAHTLVTNPITAAYSTFDCTHTHAYWLQINLVQPWLAKPGLVYATRDAPHNTVTMQVTGSLTLTLDMATMGLMSTLPLTTVVQPLRGSTSTGDLAIIYSGTWFSALAYSVKKDGAILPSNAFGLQSSRFTLQRQAIDVTHTYLISPTALNNLFLPLVLR